MAANPATPTRYQIRVKGILDHRWSHWFAELQVDTDGEDAVITGQVPDQAALHGLFTKIRDLDLFLISAHCLDADDPSRDTEPT